MNEDHFSRKKVNLGKRYKQGQDGKVCGGKLGAEEVEKAEKKVYSNTPGENGGHPGKINKFKS